MKKFWDWLTGNNIAEVETGADISSAALILMGHYVQPLGRGTSYPTKSWFFRPKNSTIGTYVTDRGLIEIAQLYASKDESDNSRSSEKINDHKCELEICDSSKAEAVIESNMIEEKNNSEYEEDQKPFYHPYTQEELEEKGWMYGVAILTGDPFVAKEINGYRVEITSNFMMIFDDGAWVKYPVKTFSTALCAATALLNGAK